MSDTDWCVEMLTDREVVRYVYREYVPSVQEVVDEMPLATSRGGVGECIGIWAIEEKESGNCLGTTLLLPLPIEKDDTDWTLLSSDSLLDEEIEIGFILRKHTWGRGFATEAASRLLQFAFEQTPLDEIAAVIDPKNLASRNVLIKIGFQEEGMRRAYAEDCEGFRLGSDAWADLSYS